MAEDQTYDDGRTEILKAMLRALADRIRALDADDAMLPHAGELMKLIGDVRDGRPGDGIVGAVELVGTLLQTHFPRSHDDQNEMPDRLIEL